MERYIPQGTSAPAAAELATYVLEKGKPLVEFAE